MLADPESKDPQEGGRPASAGVHPPGFEGLDIEAQGHDAPTPWVEEPTLLEGDALLTRWREWGFDATTHTVAHETIRPVGSSSADAAVLQTLTIFEEDLPRISVDLPGTLSGEGAEVAPNPAPRPDLEVMRALGEGGMGRIFLARQRSLNREVALKTLRDRASSRHREALLAEGAITGSLEHPGIIPVHALGLHEDGRPVLVMKRVDGVSWLELMRDPAHPAWEGWGGDPKDRLDGHLEILMQICNAAHFAHSRGIVHRDIKPENVLIGRFGDVYLADWGIAHRMSSDPVRQVCGTPACMAPEMALGGVIDARTDVYLLGATLHELLTGHMRHEGGSVAAVMLKAAASAPVQYPGRVPAGLGIWANRATAQRPEDRPQSAAEFRKGIADYLRHKSSMVLSGSAIPRLTQLRLRMQSPEQLGEAGQADMDRLITEIRFALGQALEEWPENATARRASEELETLLSVRRTRAAELERLAFELDPEVASRQRTWVIFGLAATSVVVAFVAGRRGAPSPSELFYISFVPLGALIGLLLAFRNHVMKNAINRRTAWGLMICIAGISLSRGLGLRLGLSTAAMLMHDCLLLCALTAFGSMTLFAWLRWASVLLGAAAMACALMPAHAHRWFSFGISCALGLAAWTAWKGQWGVRRGGSIL
jgi:hypothetical protein